MTRTSRRRPRRRRRCLRAHPKAPYLRLVVSQDSPAFLHFGTGDLLQKMFDVIGRWRAANSEDYSRFV